MQLDLITEESEEINKIFRLNLIITDLFLDNISLTKYSLRYWVILLLRVEIKVVIQTSNPHGWVNHILPRVITNLTACLKIQSRVFKDPGEST